MSFSEKSPKEISSSRTPDLPSQRSLCFAPFLTTMLDPFRKEILLFPIWTLLLQGLARSPELRLIAEAGCGIHSATTLKRA
jgi:hypothetical protein